jgi:signal transduction histidine kinase
MSLSSRLTRSTFQLAGQVQGLFERSPLPVVATEGPAHVVRYVNPAFSALLGQVADTIVGKPLGTPADASPRTSDDNAVALLDLVYSSGTAEFAVDLAHVLGNDSAVHLPCAVWPVVGEGGRPGGLLVLVSAPASYSPTRPIDAGIADRLVDINKRLLVASLKAQEQAELQISLRSEAEAALALRDEFMSIAAHELRTPVTGIKITAQLALRALRDEHKLDREQTAHYMVSVVGGANRLVRLINDLMDVSRMRSGQLLLRVTPLDLVELVSSVALRYAEAAGARHQVMADLPAGPLMVSGDAGRLEQILDNLLSNAVKYSPHGGEIRVRLGEAQGGVVLTVSDTGIGLTPGAQDRIFEPFGRAANASRQGLPGMGLGLHICRQIADAHGGRMWAESGGEGQGMHVSLWLPSA